MSSFWASTEQFPPVLIRLLARRHKYGPPITTEELSERSGLDYFTVELISRSTDWSCCNVVAMRKFLVACECDWENEAQRRRISAYLRNATWKHLRTDPLWPTYYEPMLARLNRWARERMK